ncbi:MAG TPA: glycosyl transferase family 1 [Bacteroidales bacterium]|jgi:glycosyltransferase involved in cell wall biosynthesis|nr:glycosyl transferase family 1 [Bacteroidales bacterium]HBZ21762.1 glycosyl transferase family 1 [Bacteroidales bacterium]
MNIGVVVDNELNDDKRVLREIEILKEAGNRIFVLCFGFSNRNYKSIEGIIVTRIRISKKLKDLLFFFLNTIPAYEWLWSARIKKFTEVNRLDFLHVHDLYMSKSGKSGIRRSGRKIPMVLDLHENYPYAVTTYNWTKGFLRNMLSRPFAWREKEKEYLGYADRIIVLSDDFRDELTGRYPELPEGIFTALPNVPDLSQQAYADDIKTDLSFKKERVLILYFGVVAERRGIFDALDVFEQLAVENHPSCFLVIGPIDKKDRERFLAKTESVLLKDRVKYIPWIDLPELPAYLEISNICLAPFHKNPQHESGVANKIFDYMLGKKPIIASDCRPQKRLIEKYNCGIIYSDSVEMKAAIIKLSEDDHLRIEMGENGYRAIITELNSSLVKEKLLKIYSS